MQSIIHHSFGEPAEVLQLAEMPRPEPKAGEVRIKTILSPMHNHDVWTVRGSYGYKPTLPAIGGSEAVGIVDAVGEGVDQSKLGQRVAVAGVHGSWAEYFIAPAHDIIALNDAFDDDAVVQLIGNGSGRLESASQSPPCRSAFNCGCGFYWWQCQW